MPSSPAPAVSIVIPVLNRLEFTKQCLDRIERNTSGLAYEVIIVDNGSSDGTPSWCEEACRSWPWLRYRRNATNVGFARANNIGAGFAQGSYLLFLNNDTLPQPGWLSEMLRVAGSDPGVGIVGIKQLFPYTNLVYHTGIVFAPGGLPQHLYPHLDASLPAVNQEREYQAVNGACLMVSRVLFAECGGFDEAYMNGYEDIDLCMRVRERGRKVVCCTGGFIYHYGQISEGRTADDDENAALFARRWRDRLTIDQDQFRLRDRMVSPPPAPPRSRAVRSLADDCIYLADDLGQASALTWVNVELAIALLDLGSPAFVRADRISPTVDAGVRRRLKDVSLRDPPIGGTQVKWSHYRPQHLDLELCGVLDLEFFVINYLFGETSREPWDLWLQSVRRNGRDKLALSPFCESVLHQIGIPRDMCAVVQPGYSREVRDVEAPTRRAETFRFLTVTNSHDLERYNTEAVIDAYSTAFGSGDDAVLVVKDYGASSGDTSLRRALTRRTGARIDYVSEFTDKRTLIELYKSCDAFVSGHRGEGFGMKILDAVACGLPVVTPLFGGPTAYCRPDNCFPVAFALTPMGDCLDTRELAITNGPLWAEVDRRSLGEQLRRVRQDRQAARAVAARAQQEVLGSFSWEHSARQLIRTAEERRERRPRSRRPPPVAVSESTYSSPYWLGLRLSVVIPTRDRKAKLLTCLDALAQQSILPHEFEVLIVDDGSSDGTADAVKERTFPFAVRYLRQDGRGPGAARNLGVEHAAGEFVLFIGDDIYADPRMLEAHLIAHAAHPGEGTAILGHIDWPADVTPNAVMEYVCGEAMLQFAYSYIATGARLDHRFFYTSNISLRRQFLLDAADAGVRFDPSFHRAAFEDSEFAFRLAPRGLDIRYAATARASHDHWMDLESFAARERGAGQMAVVFYGKHPGQDDQLQIKWMADLVQPARQLLAQPELLRQLEAFDLQTDALLRALAASLEQLLALNRPVAGRDAAISSDRVRPALHHVLKTVFDVERGRGKLTEWFTTVDDPASVRAAQTLASVTRKIEFLSTQAEGLGVAPAAGHADLQAAVRIAAGLGLQPGANGRGGGGSWRRLLASPVVVSRLMTLDRAIDARLQAPERKAWLERYRALRRKARRLLP